MLASSIAARASFTVLGKEGAFRPALALKTEWMVYWYWMVRRGKEEVNVRETLRSGVFSFVWAALVKGEGREASDARETDRYSAVRCLPMILFFCLCRGMAVKGEE